MRILTVIPARGGTKRLPGKNIRYLGGRPLIAWSIDAAVESKCAGTIIVSTDDPAIAAVSVECGAEVPWLRPRELATDSASSIDVALHALHWCESERHPVDGILLLQPTSPFRSKEAIRTAVSRFSLERPEAVVSVSPLGVPVSWCHRVLDGKLMPVATEADSSIESLPLWALNGSIYLIRPSVLKKSGTFVPVGAIALEMNGDREGIDIDDEDDWRRAEALLEVDKSSIPESGVQHARRS